jgi:hydroxymethylbilane synthase
MAGLNRLGLRAEHVVPFDVETLVPAAGQGALAVETRAGDDALASVLRACVGDAPSELCIACERAALRALHAGCSAPIGIHARFEGERMVALGAYATDGASVRRERCEARVSTLEEAAALGAALAARFAEAVRPAPETAR